MIRKIVTCTCLLTALNGCIDTIEVDLPNNPTGRLVIEGVAERSPDVYRFLVTVIRTQNLQVDTLPRIEPATISLIFNGQEILNLDNGLPTTIPIDSFHQLYGGSEREAYFNIFVTTIDGSVYTASEQKILESPVGSEIVLKYVERSELNDIGNIVERGYVKLMINAQLQNSQNERVSLKFDISGVYRFQEIPWIDDPFIEVKTCFVQDFLPGNQVNILNNLDINAANINEFEVREFRTDHRFASGYYYTVIQKALNAEAGAYWQEIQQSIMREGTIFDAPAGAARSNLQVVAGPGEEVLGFFYTAGIDTLRHLVTREESGKQLHLCAFSNNASEACCDCLLLPRSSYLKPRYWIQ